MYYLFYLLVNIDNILLTIFITSLLLLIATLFPIAFPPIVSEEIKAVITEHEKDLNNEVLNQKISKILLKYRKFYPILVIIVNNLFQIVV